MANQTISVIIIEQNKTDLKVLCSLIKKEKSLKIIGATISTEEGFLQACRHLPNILIISLKTEQVGLQFAQNLRNNNINSQIIFIGNDDTFAYTSMQFKPLDFWVNPVKRTDITSMLKRYLAWQKIDELSQKIDIYEKKNTEKAKRLFKQKKGILFLHPEEILYCRASLSSTTLFLINGKKEVCCCGISETMKNINHEDFIRVNRSYCINRKYLRKIDKKNHKCILHYNGNSWEVPSSKTITEQMEKLHNITIN